MSTLIVEVSEIKAINPHPNADLMEIATVKGWECCVRKGQFQVGDLCVYFPPDAILPTELSDKLGVTKYLSNGRVRVANLRGFKSYGLVMSNEDQLALGTQVADLYGITKYEPPIEATQGDAEREFQLFHKYYDMENIKNFPELFIPGEIVCITEKIHGQNCRLGRVYYDGDMHWCAGSHSVNRKEFCVDGTRSQYWNFLDNVKELIRFFTQEKESDVGICQGHSVVVFGEIFGSGVQDLTYGLKNGSKRFRVFDITVNGRYVPFRLKMEVLNNFGIQSVPVLYEGPFSMDVVKQHTDGKTAVGGECIREGVVIGTVMEQQRTLQSRHFSRCMLKSISFDYLNRKGGTEYH